MQIERHSQFVTVYEAQAEGVYSFVVMRGEQSQTQDNYWEFALNGQPLTGGSNAQQSFLVFMSVGDLLQHRTAPCDLKGFRIGSEF